MNRDVDREVFRYCNETCPAIDSAFTDTLNDLRTIVGSANHDELELWMDALLRSVKTDGTEKLRETLRSAVSDKQDVERDLSDSKREVRDLESRIADLEYVVREMEKELAQCAN